MMEMATKKETAPLMFLMTGVVSSWPNGHTHEMQRWQLETMRLIREPWARRAYATGWSSMWLLGMCTSEFKYRATGLIVGMLRGTIRKNTPPPSIIGTKVTYMTMETNERITVDFSSWDWSKAKYWWEHPEIMPMKIQAECV